VAFETVSVVFISAQSVGIVSSLKQAATCIKGGESKLTQNNTDSRLLFTVLKAKFPKV